MQTNFIAFVFQLAIATDSTSDSHFNNVIRIGRFGGEWRKKSVKNEMNGHWTSHP